jgi:hypothetical protein
MGGSNYQRLAGEEEVEDVASDVLAMEESMIKRSSRYVYFLCFVQLLVCSFNFVTLIIGSVCIAIGIHGVRQRKLKAVAGHFAFTVALYVMTVMMTFFMILFCDCSFWLFVAGIVFTFLQGVGVRHSRMLVELLKRQQMRSSAVELSSVQTQTTQEEDESPVSQSLIVLPAGEAPPAGYVPVGIAQQ